MLIGVILMLGTCHLAKALVLLSSNFLTPWCFYTLETCRRQFDLANREALDESAEWRMKYDEEVERSAKCDKQLIEIKQKVEDAASINQQLVMLQKENMALVGRMEVLKRELEATKLKCRSKIDR
ncbi:hypothetical protein POTOM_052811 [Populus tomentosa]|uniref:Uncharacterized protein n=1 Tax=Populus tomentosa TaxID=118781 RepID=A0A8X7Y753_POPTO|nr:hypothetical protein POTOM_052811 [Populus tomentosa]